VPKRKFYLQNIVIFSCISSFSKAVENFLMVSMPVSDCFLV